MAAAADAVGLKIRPRNRFHFRRFRSIRILYRTLGKRTRAKMTIDEIRDNFELLEEWDDRYRYVIELGRTLDPMPEAEHSAENKVNGCVSQVWLSRQIDRSGNGEPRLKYLGDSDAHIVRGLIAILLTLYSGRTPHLSRYCSGVMLYCVRKWRFSDLKRLPSSRQTRYSGVIDFFTDTAGLAGSSGVSGRPLDTRISAAWT